jgi:hypothetical protein
MVLPMVVSLGHLSCFEPEEGSKSFDEDVLVSDLVVGSESSFCLQDLNQCVFLGSKECISIPDSET